MSKKNKIEPDLALIMAAQKGNLPKFKDLLFNFHDEINIHVDDDCVLNTAVWNARLNIIDFILTSPELKEKINLKENKNLASCLSTACSRGHLYVIEYLFSFVAQGKDAELQDILERQKIPLLIESIKYGRFKIFKFALFHCNQSTVTSNLENIFSDCLENSRPSFFRYCFKIAHRKLGWEQKIMEQAPLLLKRALYSDKSSLIDPLAEQCTLNDIEQLLEELPVDTTNKELWQTILNSYKTKKQKVLLNEKYSNQKPLHRIKL